MSYVKDIATYSAKHSPADDAFSFTVASAPSPSNQLILHMNSNQAIPSTGITDSRGNTWVREKINGGCAQFLCMQNVAGLQVGDTITFAFGVATTFVIALVQEHSGITAVDVSTTGTATLTSRNAGTTATTTQANEVVCATFGVNAQETSFTPGSGYSVGTNAYVNAPAGTNGAVEAQYKYVTSTGTQSATATGGVSANSSGVVVTYKVTAGTTKQIAGNIAATSTVSGVVSAKKRVAPIGGIQATSSVSGGLGGTGGGGGTVEDAGFGISEFGIGSFGEIPTIGGGGGTGGGGTGGGGIASSVTPGQPDIVPPTTPTGDAIIDFIENSPPGLFPENDDSNFGFVIRGLWAAKVEDLIGQQDLLYKERFVDTSDVFLDVWEAETGTPVEPASFDEITRRAIVLGRIRKGPFTRAMRNGIVERYLQATFGGGVTFGPSGIPIGSGITLTGGTTAPDVGILYGVKEDVANFLYHVNIKTGYTPNAGMDRELKRVTPAGISYDINYVTSSKDAILAATPSLFWRLDEPVGSTVALDASGNNRTGAYSSHVFPGVVTSVFHSKTAPYFDGVLGIPYSKIASSYNPFAVGASRTFMGWAAPADTASNRVLFGGALGWTTGGSLLFIVPTGINWNPNGSSSSGGSWTGTFFGVGTFHWALTYNDTTKVAELFINGVSQGTRTITGGYSGTAGNNFMAGAYGDGSSMYGFMNEVAVFQSVLSAATILGIYNAGNSGVAG